jgi:hypothetical protein
VGSRMATGVVEVKEEAAAEDEVEEASGMEK